jgi:hypothetical protein
MSPGTEVDMQGCTCTAKSVRAAFTGVPGALRDPGFVVTSTVRQPGKRGDRLQGKRQDGTSWQGGPRRRRNTLSSADFAVYPFSVPFMPPRHEALEYLHPLPLHPLPLHHSNNIP